LCSGFACSDSNGLSAFGDDIFGAPALLRILYSCMDLIYQLYTNQGGLGTPVVERKLPWMLP